MKTSVIIPSRGELFLPQTINDIFKKATGEIEVIAILDGYWPNPPLEDRKNLIIIHRGIALGMRAGINAGAEIAKGKFLLKTDAHCMFAEGFDEVLAQDCADNEIIIPRRYSLDAENWTTYPKSPVDYHYLSCPMTNPDGFSMHGCYYWYERQNPRKQILIDETMSFQGSCWFMTATHFRDHLNGMSEEGYGTFSQEPQEIGNKTWLGPWNGRVMVNKKTWYAHLHKGSRYGRGYSIGKNEVIKGHDYSGYYWMGNKWEDRAHDFEWLVDRFWPVPTWPSNWKELELRPYKPEELK